MKNKPNKMIRFSTIALIIIIGCSVKYFFVIVILDLNIMPKNEPISTAATTEFPPFISGVIGPRPSEKIPLDLPLIGESDNLVINGDFDDTESPNKIKGWDINLPTKNQIKIITNTDAEHPSQFLSIVPTDGYVRLQQWVPVNDRNLYSVSGKMKLSGDLQGGAGAQIQIKWCDNKKAHLGAAITINQNEHFGTYEWNCFQAKNLTPPEGAAFIRLRLFCHGANINPDARAAFDEIRIAEANDDLAFHD